MPTESKSKSEAETEALPVLDLNKQVLRHVGLWPWQANKNGWRYTLRYYFPRVIITSASIILVLQFIDALYGEGHMTHVTENVYVSIVVVMGIIKNGTLLYRMPDVERLVYALEHLNKDGYLADKQQLAIHNRYQRFTKKLTGGFLILCFLTATNHSLSPLTNHDVPFPLPHRSYFPYNYTVQPYHTITYVWLSITAVADGFFIGVCDTLLVSILINAIGQYKQLHYKLETMRDYAVKKCAEKIKEKSNGESIHPFVRRLDNLKVTQSYKELDENNESKTARKAREYGTTDHAVKNKSQKGDKFEYLGEVDHKEIEEIRTTLKISENDINLEMERYISNVVEHHQSIITIIQDLESVFSIVLVYQFMASLVFFCMAAFQTTKLKHIDAKFIALLQLLMSSLIELYMYCWFSSVLTEESSRVNEATYYCEWMRASPSFKRSMQVIWMRTNKPIVLKAAGFVPVSLELFISVIKTSYSFYTLLAQLDTPAHHHEQVDTH